MKGLKKYLEHRRVKIIHLLEKPRSRYCPEDFHQLRTEIKKFNAVLHLIHYCSPGIKRKKLFKPFRLVFSQAGKIRELQIEEAYLQENVSNDVLVIYRQRLQMKIQQNEIEFFELLNPGMIHHLENHFKKIIPFLSEIDQSKTHRYLQMMKNEILHLICQNDLPAEKVHELRKKLKSYNYTLDCLSLKNKETGIPGSKNLGILLGDWHDLQVILGHLEEAASDPFIPPREVVEINKLIQTIRERSGKMLQLAPLLSQDDK